MKHFFQFIFYFCFIHNASQSQNIAPFFEYEHEFGNCYSNLRTLCKNVGHRLSGSVNAAKAVKWAELTMQEIVPGNVILQPCIVPHWERGRPEVCVLKSLNGDSLVYLNVLALGGSTATPKNGIEAPVLIVESFDDLNRMGKKLVSGKVVFFNHIMDSTLCNTFESYSKSVTYRWKGASEAARYGAVASIVRSICTRTDDFPHTGTMLYNDSFPKIPCFAISTLGAKLLSQNFKSDNNAKILLQSDCRWFPDAASYNIIGEIKGSDFPNEIITVGGHLDSWDVGEGAHDDGAGVVQSIEVLNLIVKLGLKPKRTIRAVAFMNEENGGRGGEAYAAGVKEGEKYIAAIESDEGAGYPLGFGIGGISDSSRRMIEKWKPLFLPYKINKWLNEGDGADISALHKVTNVPTINLIPEPSKYFHYHHSKNDVFENIDENDLKAGASAMAALIWLISENGLEAQPYAKK